MRQADGGLIAMFFVAIVMPLQFNEDVTRAEKTQQLFNRLVPIAALR